MADGWQIARARPRKPLVKQRRMYASLNRRGEITLNLTAWKELYKIEHVTLMYFAKSRVIGVKYPETTDRHYFPVRRYGRGRRNLIIRASRLLQQFDIEIERTLVFPAVRKFYFNKSFPMLLLELDQAVALKRRGGPQPSSGR